MTSVRLHRLSTSFIPATRVLANVSGNCTRPIGSSDMVYSSSTHQMETLSSMLLLTSVASSALIIP